MKKSSKRKCCICGKPFREFQSKYYNKVNRKYWHTECGGRDYFPRMHYKCSEPFECPVCYDFYKKYFQNEIMEKLKTILQ